MAAPNGPNQLARRVIDDLIDFSGETEVVMNNVVSFNQQCMELL